MTYLRDLSQRSAFFSEIDDDTTSAVLCLLDRLLDTEKEVGAAGANVGARYIASVALVCVSGGQSVRRDRQIHVNSQRQLHGLVWHFGWIPKTIHRQAAWKSSVLDPGLFLVGDEIPMGGKKTLMSPRVINWGMLVKQSVGPRTKADLPPGSYHQCAQKVTDVEYLRLRNVSGDEHHSELLWLLIPNLSATPGRYQTYTASRQTRWRGSSDKSHKSLTGSTANLVTDNSPSLFKHTLPSGTLHNG